MMDLASQAQGDRRRIVVIGPCAAGKTSLTTRLKRLGFDARTCGQEHSEIAELWKHLEPDVLVGLQIHLDTLRRRRSATWPGSIYERQLSRLASGFSHADLVIDCDEIDQEAVVEEVLTWLESHPDAGHAG